MCINPQVIGKVICLICIMVGYCLLEYRVISINRFLVDPTGQRRVKTLGKSFAYQYASRYKMKVGE